MKSWQICEDVSGPGSRFKGKHSLDSDEEDDEEDSEKTSKYNILASDDVEGIYYPCDLNCTSYLPDWIIYAPTHL